MDNFRSWYTTNQIKITWFIIGFLIAAALESFSKGNYSDALFSLVLAGANYYLSTD